ncbi:hypothetical protein PHYPO_G00096830 [Pangasianodon hypophthalmus]|uniref:Uncharacterized protein n=1 Tax=Pangasianodon hypophthalmus TaxID=310915 RepID=A0A5N5LBI2_PANHP|nr:hypothetical protein PHYPO_G00096830 [Pangasianodon hypophthalmus]
MPLRCPDHPSSPVKNALLELALLESAKHLIRKRKLRAVFVSGAYEKLSDNIPRRTPVKVGIQLFGSQRHPEQNSQSALSAAEAVCEPERGRKTHPRRLDLTAAASLLQAQLFPCVKDGQRGVTSSSSRHRTLSTSVPEPHGASLRARTLRLSSPDTPALKSSPWISPTTGVSTCCSTSCSSSSCCCSCSFWSSSCDLS